MKSYLYCLSQYANFSGRDGRAVFAIFYLMHTLASLLAVVLEFALGLGLPLSLLYGLATLVPVIAAAVRRLHDMDKSGWWLLVGLIPLVGLIFLIWMSVMPGSEDENQYGEPHQI